MPKIRPKGRTPTTLTPYMFRPIDRNVRHGDIRPAPIPHIITERYLPKGTHRVLIVLPHSDDGIYLGATTHALNELGNKVKVVVTSPGHYGINGDMSNAEKADVRWGETLRWGGVLGLKPEQMIRFNAKQTYEKQRIDQGEQTRMHTLISQEKPTMVFIPSIYDTAQHANFQTREMVMNSLKRWVKREHQRGRNRQVLIVEYPTNHVPILPPSDKNLVIEFTDQRHTNAKHEANRAHESVAMKGIDRDMLARLSEALATTTEADDVRRLKLQAQRDMRRYARHLSGVDMDARTSRGEHFGITKMVVRTVVTPDGKRIPVIREERLLFPLKRRENLRLWENGEST